MSRPHDAALLGEEGSASASTLLEPVKLRSAGEHIADRLVTAIALGEFVPGQRLPTERDLATTLGVSRSTVREAMHRLEALGYVDVRRGRHGGAYVRSGWQPGSEDMIRRTLLPAWDRFESLFDFRHLIEPLIARTAADRRSDDDVAAIRTALQTYRDAGDDREASRAADEALHAAVARATHNPYLVHLSDRIRRDISLGFGAEPYSREIRARALESHAALVGAVETGAADRAAEVAELHFALTETTVRALMERVERRSAEREER